MVLNNSEFFPTLLNEAVDFAKNYNVEIPPIGGAVNNPLQVQKLLENFQLSDGKEVGGVGDRTSIDNFLIYGQQGYVTPVPETTASQEDADFLTGNKQEAEPSSLSPAIVEEHSHESDGLIAGVGDKVNIVPPASTNSQFQSAFTPATINVTYSSAVPIEARTAFDYAVDNWEKLIYSPVPINIQVDWPSLNPGILGQGGPSLYTQNFTSPANAQPNTWYPIALANSLVGIDLAPTTPDLNLNFNGSRADWYFGTDRNTLSGRFDFVTVAMHEIGHGLGINGYMQSNSGVGQWGSFPAIYDRFPVNSSGQSLINTSIFPNPSTTLGNQLISNALLFNGPNARNANANNNPRLSAPNPWSGGSSFYHFDENAYPAGINSLMTPTLNPKEAIHEPGPVALGLLKDLGWAVNTSPTFNPVTTFRDFSGDGKADIFWRDPVSGLNSIWLIDNTLTPLGFSMSTLDSNWQVQGTADFNGDGKGDILWRNVANGLNSIWLMNGTSQPPGYSLSTLVGSNWQVQGTGDFSGDGKADILWRDTVNGNYRIWWMSGTNGTQETPGSITPLDPNLQLQGTGDFNADGKADILWRNPVSGQNYLWFMNGTPQPLGYEIGSLDSNWQVQGIGDFSGDGIADILWRHRVNGNNKIWLNGNIATSADLGSPGSNWQVQGTGDFSGDGKADIFWRDAVNGTNAIWRMDGTNLFPGNSNVVIPLTLSTTYEAVG